MHFLVFNTVTGAIVRSGNCQEEHLNTRAKQALGEAIMHEPPVGVNSGTHYVEDYECIEKTVFAHDFNSLQVPNDGLTEIILDNLPIPCDIYIDYEKIKITDGNFEFSSNDVGFYSVRLEHPRYFDKSWEIEVYEI